MGMLAQAIDVAEAAVRAHEEIGTQGATRVEALITLIRAHRESGQLDRAEDHIRRAEEIFAGGMHFLALEVDVLLEHAAIMSSRGDIDGASETCLKCLHLLRKLSDPGREAATYTAIGRTLREQGRTDEAIEFYRRAAATLRGHHDAFQLAVSLISFAELLDAAGRRDEARTCRAEANDLLSPFDDPRVTDLRAHLAEHS
jgi:tetratricopeptide (TPR) repeat protein